MRHRRHLWKAQPSAVGCLNTGHCGSAEYHQPLPSMLEPVLSAIVTTATKPCDGFDAAILPGDGDKSLDALTRIRSKLMSDRPDHRCIMASPPYLSAIAVATSSMPLWMFSTVGCRSRRSSCSARERCSIRWPCSWSSTSILSCRDERRCIHQKQIPQHPKFSHAIKSHMTSTSCLERAVLAGVLC